MEQSLAPGKEGRTLFMMKDSYLHLFVPGSLVLVWLVEGRLPPPSCQEMVGAGLENLVTHSTWWGR